MIREIYIYYYEKTLRGILYMCLAEKRFNKRIIRNYMRKYDQTGNTVYLKEALKYKRHMNER